jgi:hypothetical protein
MLYNWVAFAIFDFVAGLECLVEMGPQYMNNITYIMST